MKSKLRIFLTIGLIALIVGTSLTVFAGNGHHGGLSQEDRQARMQERLEACVAEGRISQEKANQRMQQMKEHRANCDNVCDGTGQGHGHGNGACDGTGPVGEQGQGGVCDGTGPQNGLSGHGHHGSGTGVCANGTGICDGSGRARH
ncbi:MAG: hypothetical protein GX127_01690 [Eubacteriaceae bacterium]|nr:hypothetical protein [Eubacteriaceae bacterium]